MTLKEIFTILTQKNQAFLIRNFNQIKFTCRLKNGNKYPYDFILKIRNYAQCHSSQVFYVEKNSMALVRKRTIPTERPPPVGEVSANFCGQRGVTWSAQRIPRPLISVFWTEAATFYSSSSSIDLTRLSGPRSRPTTTQKIWQRRESNPRPLYLQPETLTTRPQRRSIIHLHFVIILRVQTSVLL